VALNVLVTAVGSTIGQGILKAIKRSSLDCRIVTTDASPDAAGLYRGNVGYVVPLGKDPGFIEIILGICRRENIHAICIGTDYELLPLANNRDRIKDETGADVIVSRPETIRTADDKWLTAQFLQSNSFPSIPTALPEDVDGLVEAEGFPLIVKPRVGDSSKDTVVVPDMATLRSTLERLGRAPHDNRFVTRPSGFVVQKYIGTAEDEFTSTTMVVDGHVYGVLSMRREMRFGGHTTKAMIEPVPHVDQVIRTIAQKLAPTGPCNLQSRVINGVPYVFEINCRFSGTTATCAQAGFNHVEACLRRITLNEEIPDLSFRSGMMVRYFNELFIPFADVEAATREGRIINSGSDNNTFF
jgi:carbamoyl-phosphate synthase large subunit